MHRTYLYITDLLLFSILISGNAYSQPGKNTEKPDSVDIALKIRTGIDIAGPVIWFTDKNIFNAEAYITTDINEKSTLYLGAGYSDYNYSQYNYDYLSRGFFVKAGIDLNILKPEVSEGRYWAGVGIRYGISNFTSGTPSFTHENYWGITQSSIESTRNWGHFIELSPGFRAELLKNLSIGWSISLRKLIFPGSKKDIRPLFIPGYGSGASVSAGACYFISWNIPYKKIRVEVKKEEPEELPEEDETNETGVNTNSQSLGRSRPGMNIR